MNRRVQESELFQGDLGETSTSTVPMTADSGEVFRAEVYTTVNVSQNPELRDELVDGSLNVVEGPDGEETYEPAVAVRYHDQERRVFALVIPNQLRHRAFELRRELLEALEQVDASIPDYVSDFATVFDPSRLEKIERAGTARDFEPSAGELDTNSAADGGGSASAEAEVDEQLEEIEHEWEEIEEARAELAQREEQLEEVHDRIDRERARMDEVEQELAAEREELEQMRDELEAERQELEAEKLRLEEQARKAERDEEEAPDEVTQVVTDDQFVEVTEEPDEEGLASSSEVASSGEVAAPRESTAVTEPPSPSASAPSKTSQLEPELGVVVDTVGSSHVPDEFDSDMAGALDGYVEIDDGVVAVCRLSEERADTLAGEAPVFYVQYHEIDGVPIAALTLAALDDEGAVEASFGWPLHLGDETELKVVERLCEEMDLRVAIFDDDEEFCCAYRVRGPLEENMRWIRREVESASEDADSDEFEAAAELFGSEQFERVGTMRHNFDRDAFHDLETASQVKLAAGVVGFWSSPEQFEYLVANRSHPLLLFRALQEDVVAAALENGIYLEAPLREIALEMELVDDEPELVERQLANFAELAVQLRDSDLDPVDEWENWDALIELAQQLGVTPDPDVIELAESSLKRARDYQETQQPVADLADEEDDALSEDLERA